MERVLFTCTEASIGFHDPVDEVTYHIFEGETRMLPPHIASKFCAEGWGTADGCETGERKPGVRRLELESTVVVNKAKGTKKK